MKSTKRTVTSIFVVLLVLCTLCMALTACVKKPNPDPGNHTQIENPETRAFTMSIATPDGVFNPFFSTSGNDSTIISMTQIGMLSSDKDGGIVYGENEACVVKDMKESRTQNGNTLYEFLIKKGIKWSDGIHDLTIKDVLFNLYVYLDPAYTGSATIYSTDIVGLKNYRLQTTANVDGDDTIADEFNLLRRQEAQERINNDINYVKKNGNYSGEDKDFIQLPADFSEKEALLDYAVIAKTFWEELNSDWNNISVGDYDWRNPQNFKARPNEFPDATEPVDQFGNTFDYYEQFLLTEKWQVFMLSDAGRTQMYKYDYAGGPISKVDGNALFDSTEVENVFYDEILPDLIEKELAVYDDNDKGYVITGDEEDVEEAIKEICLQSVFSSYFSLDFPMDIITRVESKLEFKDANEEALMLASLRNTPAVQFERILSYWVTATTILDKFTGEATSNFFAKNDKIVKTISGITTKSVSTFNGQALGEQYDVLSIEIKGVDPKAIYNFAFNVAPMYYYSTTSWNNGKGNKDYINSFDAANGEFGLEFGSSRFMNEVVNDAKKIGLPIGAGPYIASKFGGGAGTSDTFLDKNIVYYERNPYFYTVGSGLQNAKIKTIKYKVVETDQIISSLTTGEIDFGEPNATQPNMTALDNAGLVTKPVFTNGYGYVGINPRFVPSIEVRRAIMKAMDTSIISENYYQGGLCEIINRPMSTQNWAYPQNIGVYYYDTTTVNPDGSVGKSYDYDDTGIAIKELVESAGYTKNSNGVYHKEIAGFGDDVLDYKFTIAGGSTDHPAYAMFLNAEKVLNRVGFNVKVVTSVNALTDLNAGKLEVWAAAWSSTVDPDMFQVYHKDSQASSTKNWGYSQILGMTCPDAWGDEYNIVMELSKLIDDGRKYTERDQRKPIYRAALDKVMELAVEFPTYQRKDLFAYKAGLLDPATLTPDKDVTAFNGLLSRIWEVNYL